MSKTQIRRCIVDKFYVLQYINKFAIIFKLFPTIGWYTDDINIKTCIKFTEL